MSLIKCNECEKEISDKAKICPHCGYPMIQEKNTRYTDILLALFTFAIASALIGSIAISVIKAINEKNTFYNSYSSSSYKYY